MKRVLILVLALTTLAAARDKKPKAQPGPYVFSSKASAQTIRTLIVQDNVNAGYTLDSDKPLQLRFSKPGQMPVIGALFMASSACPGMTTKQVWSYTLAEVGGATKVTVEPGWEYPDDYCQTQTHELIWNKPEEIAAFQAMLDKAPAASAQPGAQTSAPVSAAAAPAPVPSSTPTAVAKQQPVGPATQSPAQTGSPDENSENAARRAKQHAACLELAKDNPSINCK
jgi:hypothetical protein